MSARLRRAGDRAWPQAVNEDERSVPIVLGGVTEVAQCF